MPLESPAFAGSRAPVAVPATVQVPVISPVTPCATGTALATAENPAIAPVNDQDNAIMTATVEYQAISFASTPSSVTLPFPLRSPAKFTAPYLLRVHVRYGVWDKRLPSYGVDKIISSRMHLLSDGAFSLTPAKRPPLAILTRTRSTHEEITPMTIEREGLVIKI